MRDADGPTTEAETLIDALIAPGVVGARFAGRLEEHRANSSERSTA